jgi:hypothetical protein
MKSQKISVVFLFLIVFSLMSPLVSAANTPSGGGIFGGGSSSEDLTLGNPFGILWEPIKSIFSGIEKMSESDAKIVMRALVFLVIFVVFFGVFKWLSSSSKGFEWLGGNIAMVLSFALAVMSCIFIPEQALTAIGGSYGQIAMLILFMPVLLMMIFLVIKTENHWAKLALLLASTYMVAYFNMFFKASRYADNSIGGIIFRVLSAVLAVWMLIELFGGLGSLSFGGGNGLSMPSFMKRAERGEKIPGARDEQVDKAQNAVKAATDIAHGQGLDVENKIRETINAEIQVYTILRNISNLFTRLGTLAPTASASLANKKAFVTTYQGLRTQSQGLGVPLKKILDDATEIRKRLEDIGTRADQANQEFEKMRTNINANERNNLRRMLRDIQNEILAAKDSETKFREITGNLEREITDRKGPNQEAGPIRAACLMALSGQGDRGVSIFKQKAKEFMTFANTFQQLKGRTEFIGRNFSDMEKYQNEIRQRLGVNTEAMKQGMRA